MAQSQDMQRWRTVAAIYFSFHKGGDEELRRECFALRAAWTASKTEENYQAVLEFDRQHPPESIA